LGPVAGNTEPSIGGQGDNPRARIAIGVLTLLKEIYGRGPERVRVYLLEDVVLVVLSGGFTRVEATLLELGHGQAVRDQRAVVEEAMRQPFTELIESETGRKVKSLMSASDQGADVSSAVILLEPPLRKGQAAEAD
jgi:uncharacterized protein YbcI